MEKGSVAWARPIVEAIDWEKLLGDDYLDVFLKKDSETGKWKILLSMSEVEGLTQEQKKAILVMLKHWKSVTRKAPK